MKAAIRLLMLWLIFPPHAASETFRAKINDPDGYVNLRLRPDANAPVLGKLMKDDNFYVSTTTLPDSPEWYPATRGDDRFGFIHKSRVKLIEKAKHALILAGVSLAQRTKAGSADPAAVFLKAEDFNVNQHNLTKNARGGVQLINGREPYGIDGSVPKTKLSQFAVFFSGRKIQVDPKWYSDCYEVTLSEDKVSLKVSQSGDEILLTMSASGGAGHYTATWIAEKGAKVSRFISYP